MVQDNKWPMDGLEPQMTGITWPEKLLCNITPRNKHNGTVFIGGKSFITGGLAEHNNAHNS